VDSFGNKGNFSFAIANGGGNGVHHVDGPWQQLEWYHHKTIESGARIQRFSPISNDQQEWIVNGNWTLELNDAGAEQCNS
jgi:hypothetical protein